MKLLFTRQGINACNEGPRHVQVHLPSRANIAKAHRVGDTSYAEFIVHRKLMTKSQNAFDLKGK